jgi:hypothetical protein
MRKLIPRELENGLKTEAYPSVLSKEHVAVIEILRDVVLL